MHQKATVRAGDPGENSNNEAAENIDYQCPYRKNDAIFLREKIGEPHSGRTPKSANNHNGQIAVQHSNFPPEEIVGFEL